MFHPFNDGTKRFNFPLTSLQSFRKSFFASGIRLFVHLPAVEEKITLFSSAWEGFHKGLDCISNPAVVGHGFLPRF